MTVLTDRGLLRLAGEDAREFLQGLVTNDVALLAPERPLWAALLSAQGKALFDFILWADGADVLIDCEREAAGALAQRLTLYRLRRAITIAREEELCVHWAADGEAGVPDPRLGALGRQVVLTGGGAELKGVADYAQGVLGRAVRIGRPNLPGLPEAHSGPGFSTLAGLALFAASDEGDLPLGPVSGSEKAPGNWFQRLIAAFRTQY